MRIDCIAGDASLVHSQMIGTAKDAGRHIYIAQFATRNI